LHKELTFLFSISQQIDVLMKVTSTKDEITITIRGYSHTLYFSGEC